jgi:hypothetical protein
VSGARRGGGIVDYVDTLIVVADDCPVTSAQVPTPRGGKPTVATIQFDLLDAAPYAFRQAEILFATHCRQQGLDERALGTTERQRRFDAFFAAPKPCLRASPLPKRYGWGVHFDGDGRAALHAVGSAAYDRLASSDTVTVVRAMRTRRAT